MNKITIVPWTPRSLNNILFKVLAQAPSLNRALVFQPVLLAIFIVKLYPVLKCNVTYNKKLLPLSPDKKDPPKKGKVPIKQTVEQIKFDGLFGFSRYINLNSNNIYCK